LNGQTNSEVLNYFKNKELACACFVVAIKLHNTIHTFSHLFKERSVGKLNKSRTTPIFDFELSRHKGKYFHITNAITLEILEK
jgi:hypothetical protein